MLRLSEVVFCKNIKKMILEKLLCYFTSMKSQRPCVSLLFGRITNAKIGY